MDFIEKIFSHFKEAMELKFTIKQKDYGNSWLVVSNDTILLKLKSQYKELLSNYYISKSKTTLQKDLVNLSNYCLMLYYKLNDKIEVD